MNELQTPEIRGELTYGFGNYAFAQTTVALSIGKSFSMMVVIIPISLLLTFKAMEIDPNRSTYVFILVSGIGAIFALLGNPLGGAISDRTTLKFGRRRTWIMLGSILKCRNDWLGSD